MPELPEVETSCHGIRPHCVGSKINKIEVRQKKLRWPVDENISKKLASVEITAVNRRGKYILLQVGKSQLMIHLGMSGSLRVLQKPVAPGKHDHVDICLSNNKVIRYNDPRRFGSIILNKDGLSHPLLAKLGVEPLEDEFDGSYLHQVCTKRSGAIKALIMNGQLIVGVGNIYAQEALFRAGIHPARGANKIAKHRLDLLVDAIKQILAEAIEAGGSSLKDFTSTEGKPGYFQHTHQVYGRGGMPCNICKAPLKQKVISQRTTAYCSHCQK